MRIGSNLWIWESPITVDVIRQYALRVAAWGFDTIELPLENPGDWFAKDVRQVLEENGLRAGVCAVMAPGRDLTSSDASVVRSTQNPRA